MWRKHCPGLATWHTASLDGLLLMTTFSLPSSRPCSEPQRVHLLHGRFSQRFAHGRKASNTPRKAPADFASLPPGNEKSPELGSGLFVISGGERGIRTPDRLLTYTRFPENGMVIFLLFIYNNLKIYYYYF